MALQFIPPPMQQEEGPDEWQKLAARFPDILLKYAEIKGQREDRVMAREEKQASRDVSATKATIDAYDPNNPSAAFALFKQMTGKEPSAELQGALDSPAARTKSDLDRRNTESLISERDARAGYYKRRRGSAADSVLNVAQIRQLVSDMDRRVQNAISPEDEQDAMEQRDYYQQLLNQKTGFRPSPSPANPAPAPVPAAAASPAATPPAGGGFMDKATNFFGNVFGSANPSPAAPQSSQQALPAAADQTVRRANGKAVTFSNGEKWAFRNGVVQRVQ